jgi:hypothetical protein
MNEKRSGFFCNYKKKRYDEIKQKIVFVKKCYHFSISLWFETILKILSRKKKVVSLNVKLRNNLKIRSVYVLKYKNKP